MRLILGDCLEVLSTLPDASVDAVVTDPPYGISYRRPDVYQGGRSGVTVPWNPIVGDAAPDGRWLADAFRVLRSGGAFYLVTRWDVEPTWRGMLAEAGFRLRQRLTWHKRVNGKGDVLYTYAPTCEDILFASKGRHRLRERPSMLLDVGCVPTWEVRCHPHQKPTALAEVLIRASVGEGGTVLDPFMGSGTTGVACSRTGRDFIGVEIDPGYFAVAQKRIAEEESRYALFRQQEFAQP